MTMDPVGDYLEKVFVTSEVQGMSTPDPIRAKLDDESPLGAWAEDCREALRNVLDLMKWAGCDGSTLVEIALVERAIATALGLTESVQLGHHNHCCLLPRHPPHSLGVEL